MLEPKVDIFESHFRDYHELLISLVLFWSAIVETVCEKRPRTIQNSLPECLVLTRSQCGATA